MTSNGTLVVKEAEEYQIKIKSKGKIDLLTVTSCHREIFRENIKKKEVTITYRPVVPIETKGSCLLDIGAYEKRKGRHGWAIVDFESPEHRLQAMIKCNGRSYLSEGVTICQAKQGLIQEIEFENKVVTTPAVECPIYENVDDKIFSIEVQPGPCLYLFVNKKTNKVHKLTLYGYEAILMRGD